MTEEIKQDETPKKPNFFEQTIAFIIPAKDSIPVEFFAAYEGLLKPANNRLMIRYTEPSDRNLNELVTQVLSGKTVPTYIAILNTKVLPVRGTLARLWSDNVDCVAALSFDGSHPFFPAIYTNLANDKVGVALEYERDKLIKVDQIALDFVLLKTEALKKIAPPYFEFGIDKNGARTISMEKTLCDKFKAAGVDIYVDPKATVARLHKSFITEEWWLRSKDEYMEKRMIELKKSPEEAAKRPSGTTEIKTEESK